MKNKNLINDERGYALIEVIFLVTVIAILSSVVVPQISNSLKIVQSDYLMKTIYSEFRFIQATSRVTTYKKTTEETDIFQTNKTINKFFLDGNDKNIKITYYDTFRSYELPPGFYFENKFAVSASRIGIFKDLFTTNSTTSSHIKLMNNSKSCKPVIVFDSVGRVRFSDS